MRDAATPSQEHLSVYPGLSDLHDADTLRGVGLIATRPQTLPWQDYEAQKLPGDGKDAAIGMALVIGFGVAFWSCLFAAVLS